MSQKSRENDPVDIVDSRYHVQSVLGTGTSSTVYLAEDMQLKKRVAVKILEPNPHSATQIADQLARFEREAQISRQLKHPQIVEIYDYGLFDDKAYIVMAYLPGKTLKDYFESQYVFTLREVIHIFKQLAQALDYAHQQGVVHRDIKPENMKLIEDQHLKLMDFGVARQGNQFHTLTEQGSVLGTVAYMPPEQIHDSRSVDHRADIFSMGCVVYQLLTGVIPFEADNMAGTIRRIMEDNPRPLHHYLPELPGALEQLVFGCLHKAKEKRIQSAGDILAGLQALELDSEQLERNCGMPIEKIQETPSVRQFKILHIEDDLIWQRLIRKTIESQSLPYRYCAASSLAEAQDMLHHQIYDFVICDYFLGDGDAMPILEQLSATPTIVTTSTVEPQTIVKIMKTGVLDYCIKSNPLVDCKKVVELLQKNLKIN